METIQIAANLGVSSSDVTSVVTSIINTERILSKDQYLHMKSTWAKNNSHSAADMVTYNVLRGFPADRGFVPLTVPSKITSRSNDKWDGFNTARNVANANLMTAITPTRWRTLEQDKAILDKHISDFKGTFGLDITPEIQEALKAVELKK